MSFTFTGFSNAASNKDLYHPVEQWQYVSVANGSFVCFTRPQ